MISLQQLQADLLALSKEDKTKAIKMLAASLNDTWIGIEKSSEAANTDIFICRTGIAVWFLVHQRNQGISDAEILAECPQLTAKDLANAWLYAQLHTDEIESAIQRNLVKQHSDLDDDSKEEVLENLKQAWQEAKSSNTIPLSQMWDVIND
ncbi:MAG: DUF433 domain-containing protein [Leptolyngbyaceae cyanobacterium]